MNIELTDREVTCLEKAVESVIKGMYEKLRLTEDEEYRMLLGEPLSELERIAEKLARQQNFKPFTPQEAREVWEYISSRIPEKKQRNMSTLHDEIRSEYEKPLASLTNKSHWSVRAALRIATEANRLVAEPYITQIARIIREEQYEGEWVAITDQLPHGNEWHLTSFKGCIPRVLFRDKDGKWPASKEIPPTHFHTPRWSDLKTIQ